jgi:hypothetical protein
MRKQRIAFTILIIFVFGLAITYSPGPTLAEQENRQTDHNVSFLWAFGAIKKTDQGLHFTKITRDTELKSGDQLKMLVKLKKKCFVYVFYYSSQGQLHMLLPYHLNQFSTDYEISKSYYIPRGNFVLELDENIGEEKIYLIASVRRLHELENLFDSYDSAEGAKRPESIENIIKEIRNLRKRHKKFTAEAERPIASTGSIRAHIISEKTGLPNLEKFAVQINTVGFFARTFTIDHK